MKGKVTCQFVVKCEQYMLTDHYSRRWFEDWRILIFCLKGEQARGGGRGGDGERACKSITFHLQRGQS